MPHAAQTQRDPVQAPLSPPLKWAGGKRWLVATLRPLWDPRRRLVEPFCGGLAVALGLQPERALLNDQNPHLVGFYQALQSGLIIPEAVRLENEPEVYYAQRAAFNRLTAEAASDGVQRAGLFYYLNRTGYNGLCRFNRRGGFNVPFGRYARIGYQRDFRAYAPVLSRWSFTSGPFEAVAVTADDWVYADPPYDVPFVQYAREGFTWEDQVRLAEWLASLPCPVVASNQATPRILALYQGLGFRIQTLPGPRRIACTGNRQPALEMLATRGLRGAG